MERKRQMEACSFSPKPQKNLKLTCNNQQYEIEHNYHITNTKNKKSVEIPKVQNISAASFENVFQITEEVDIKTERDDDDSETDSDVELVAATGKSERTSSEGEDSESDELEEEDFEVITAREESEKAKKSEQSLQDIIDDIPEIEDVKDIPDFIQIKHTNLVIIQNNKVFMQ